MQYFYVFLGGGLGSVTRFFMTNLVSRFFGTNFPYGTLTVNVLGSFIIGILFSVNENHLKSIPIFKQLVLIGFLGGFTTFSSFSLETMNLFIQGKILSSLLNVILNLLNCLIAVTTGYMIAKFI